MSAHDDFVSVSVNVALAERNRFGQHVIAGTQKVNVEYLVVFNEAENALIVVAGSLRAECNNDSLRGVGLDYALSH